MLDDYTFNFLIDDEICQVQVIKEAEGRFSYNMRIDTETKTELNEKRHKHDRAERIKVIVLVSVSVLVFISCLIAEFVFDAFNPVSPINYVEDARFETASVDYSSTMQPEFSFFFRTIKYKSNSQLLRRFGSTWLTATGLPLSNQDSFFVSFIKFTPYNARIHYDRPSRKQMRRYQKRLRAFVPLSHLGPYRSDRYCDCVTHKLFKWRGFPAWADLYFQNTALEDNILHNKVTFQTLRNSPLYGHILQRCAAKYLRLDSGPP